MGNSGLALSPINFCVQMAQTTGSGIRQLEESPVVQRSAFQKIIQRSVFVIVCNQVELCPGASALNICSYETYVIYKQC